RWSRMYTTGPARETGAAWATALQLAETLEDTDYQLRALWGLWAGHINNGKFREALKFAERFATVATKAGDPSDALIGECLLGPVFSSPEEHAGARDPLKRMLRRFAPPPNRSDVIRFRSDQ